MVQVSPPLDKSLVTISIVSHGDAEKVTRLLGSLQTWEQNHLFRVILTDNLRDDLPSLDSSGAALITILRNEHPCGFGRNHNQAFRLVETNYYCILNPDVIFEQEVFGRLIALLETGKADIIAPLVVDSNGAVQDSFRVIPTPMNIVKRKLPFSRFVQIPSDAEGLVRPDWMAGIFLLLKSETYHKIGGFDESYRLYFEDVDFCTRARLAGLKLLVDTGVRIKHSGEHASRKNFRYLFWHIQSALRFFNSRVYRQARQNKSTAK